METSPTPMETDPSEHPANLKGKDRAEKEKAPVSARKWERVDRMAEDVYPPNFRAEFGRMFQNGGI